MKRAWPLILLAVACGETEECKKLKVVLQKSQAMAQDMKSYASRAASLKKTARALRNGNKALQERDWSRSFGSQLAQGYLGSRRADTRSDGLEERGRGR